MNTHGLTVGSDPEFLLENPEHVFISSQSACDMGLKAGDKETPLLMSVGSIHRDNALIELNVPPSDSEQVFIKNHSAVKSLLLQALPTELVLSNKASGHFTEEELWHPEALLFGCEPDFNAWDNGSKNPPPDSGTSLRSAAGHVHIGYQNPNMDSNLNIVRACDLFLGVPSLLMDQDTERRILYGKAGAFRHKPYGVEYRVLSNFWMMEEELMGWVYRNTERAFLMRDQFNWNHLEEVASCINSNDVELARYLCTEFNLEVLGN